MRRAVRALGKVLAGLLVLLVAILGAGGVLLWLTLPPGFGQERLPGLAATVDVGLDADGVPRIRAGSEADAAMALGYLHARDRMFQMDMTRRAAAGELSEVIGGLGLSNDRQMRVLGVRRSAEADLRLLPADTLALLDAYAAGVNALITARGRFAGAEYLVLGSPRRWAAVDSLLWSKMMGLYLSGNWRAELARAGLAERVPPDVLAALWPATAGGEGRPEAALVPSLPPGVREVATQLAAMLPSFPAPFTLPSSASDEWAVDGRFTASGAPMLAGDPHLGFAMPGTWYLARIDTPGHVLAGATAPGVPFMVLGHNGRIAWTFTNTGADVQDLFVETPAGPDAYMTPDGPRPFAVRDEVIHVRDGADEILRVRETRHGPLISDLVSPRGPLLAIAMANLAPGDTAATGLHALNRAPDVAAAGRAAGMITAPVQNLLVADRAGIGLFVTGRIPIRRGGDGALPGRGDDGSTDWTGLTGGDALPRFVAPPSGRLVNGNERIAPPDFPVYLGRDWPGDWRARRIRELLSATPSHTAASFAAMQVDTVSLFARDVLPVLTRLTPDDAPARAAIALLARWSGQMDAGRPEPLIFAAWMKHFRATLLDRNGIGESAALAGWEMVEPAILTADSPLCGGPCGPLLRQSLTDAMAEQSRIHGSDLALWQWGAAHQAVFAHPLLGAIPWLRALGTARIASPGDDTTLFRAAMRNGFDAIHGAAFRAVYDLSNLEASRFVITPGQSGNIVSGNAWNFVQRWRDGATVTLGATAPETGHLVLTPQ